MPKSVRKVGFSERRESPPMAPMRARMCRGIGEYSPLPGAEASRKSGYA